MSNVGQDVFDQMRESEKARELDERTLDDFLERMTGEGCLVLLQWGRRYAPHLLRLLIASFLKGQEVSPDEMVAISSKAAERTLSYLSTLETAERQHIARVISECKTLAEAASKLGIHPTTLWRKRKLYTIS